MRNTFRLLTAFTLFIFYGAVSAQETDNRFVSFTTDPSSISFFWKDDTGQIFKTIQNLKIYIEKQNRDLGFAMNGGMYRRDHSPQGLYIEDSKILSPLDTLSGSGNFYLKPNGVFYITADSMSMICKTEDFVDKGNIKFATQSGPMLVIDGEIHPAFKIGSTNLNVRNGVGILPDNRVVFAISREEVNFYDFASYFKSLGCKNALYLDGFVSRAYIPDKNWLQLDGSFGVIIGVSE
jgi:uncharacterized protein YigE (DUF2233 family)